MTLDYDDVELAESWLCMPERWQDTSTVKEYEAAFARWTGAAYAVSFAGARVALSACVYALDLQPGDEVILPGYTCVVVPNAFEFAGVAPRFVDIEDETFGIDANALAQALGPRTRAIVLQHLFGLVCRDYEQILDLAARQGIAVIEDCAHAAGAEFRGRRVGTRGTLGIFSSEQSKVLNTMQGGIAVTADAHLAKKLHEYQQQAPFPESRSIRAQLHNVQLSFAQGKASSRWLRGEIAEWRYGDYRIETTTDEEINRTRPANYGLRMAAPTAALGVNQLKKVERYNSQRRAAAEKWDAWCDARGYRKPLVIPDSVPVFLRYPVLVEPEIKRDIGPLQDELGVEIGVWFKTNLHPAPATLEGCPVADRCVDSCINFPTLA